MAEYTKESGLMNINMAVHSNYNLMADPIWAISVKGRRTAKVSLNGYNLILINSHNSALKNT